MPTNEKKASKLQETLQRSFLLAKGIIAGFAMTVAIIYFVPEAKNLTRDHVVKAAEQIELEVIPTIGTYKIFKCTQLPHPLSQAKMVITAIDNGTSQTYNCYLKQ